jgi:hypothetical protein
MAKIKGNSGDKDKAVPKDKAGGESGDGDEKMSGKEYGKSNYIFHTL